jgi:hypothetical protein
VILLLESTAKLKPVTNFSIRTTDGNNVRVFPPGERCPETERQGDRVEGVISQAAHARRSHIVEDPFIAYFVARMAGFFVTDQFYNDFIFFGFHSLAPLNDKASK